MLRTSLHDFWILNHFFPKRESLFVVGGDKLLFFLKSNCQKWNIFLKGGGIYCSDKYTTYI